MYKAALCELKMKEVSRERSDKLDETQKKLDQFYENVDVMRQNQNMVSEEEELVSGESMSERLIAKSDVHTGILIPYSRKIWRALNLADWPQPV